MKVYFYSEKHRKRFTTSFALLKSGARVTDIDPGIDHHGNKLFPLYVKGGNKDNHEMAKLAGQFKSGETPPVVLFNCSGENLSDCGDYERCHGTLCEICSDTLGYTRKDSNEA